ncbi:putative ribonuclease H-like domain-containing protein [Tanacetum coccineum]
MTHPHPNRRFVPQAVLTKSSKINTAGASVNTAVRPVNTVGSKPTVNHPRSISNAYKKGYSQFIRPFNKYSEYKNSIFNKKVNTVRVKDTTARDRAVVNENKGKGINAVKASACWLLDESQVLLRVPRKDNNYSIDLKSVVPTKGLTCLFAKATIDESNLWHRRLGHINFKNMNKLVRGNLIRGLPSKNFENDHSCVACQKGKQHKASCKAKLVYSISKPLHVLHMDLFGPTNVKSLMKKSYCLVVTDDFSRFSWVFFLTTKDETSGILKTFIIEIENQLDHKVKVIKSDNGTEFKNTERKNRTLIEAVRTMVLVIKPHNKTPYELIRGRPPLIDFMKPFGCPVTILNTRDHLGKFDGKADEGYFVGYFVVSQAQKEKELEQEYILIPLCTTDPLISQGPKDCEGDAGIKPIEVDEHEASDKSRKHEQEARSDSERTAGPSFDTVVPSTPVNVAGPFVSIANESEEQLFERFSPFKNAFTLPPVPNISSMDNTGIFGNAYDDEDVEEEVDMNNMDVKSALLYGTIDEEVYVCQPPSFEDPQFPDKVYKGYKYNRRRRIFLSQDKYVADILKKFDFATVKTLSTPTEPNKELVKDEEADSVDVHLYRSMIGSLMYLIASRPDIMIVVCACAWFQVTPKRSHLHAVKRIFRYLKGQPKLGLWYPRDSPFDLEAFSDSDYARASLDRKSTIEDETVYKEWEDKMERAATTASSLDAEQDSGSGPRCQDTILGGADAQTRFETASKQSNYPPLSRGYTLRSREDNTKLLELMELYIKLSDLISKSKREML